jgi:alkylated DNA repair dioxygenase AlkB
VSWQGSLLDDGPAQVDVSFNDLRRIQLDETSWIDVAPGWLRGSDELFAELVQSGRWGQREVHMYDKLVIEPRLTAGWDTDVDGAEMPPALRAISAALSARYAVPFDRIWVNLYRDGRDSVAWHGDRNRHTHRNPLVGTVSLGTGRRFLLRPRGGRTQHEFRLGHGDLVVMGGACQHDWEHTVPKEARVTQPRISVTLRHSAHIEPAPQ